jgi:serine/threonine protein kinase
MDDNDDIQDLLLRWRQAREAGTSITAEELCRERPELLETLKQRIESIEMLRDWLKDARPTPENLPLPSDSTETAHAEPPPPPAEAARGVLPEVPGYDVLEVLGRGGMGVVYKARHRQLGRLVALKMISAGAHAPEADLSRFRTEAQAIATIRHPNIVQIFDVDEHQGLPYFSLEYCDGGTLRQKLAGTPLGPGEAAELVEILADAVHCVHQENIIHRDLKPGNILLSHRDPLERAREESLRARDPVLPKQDAGKKDRSRLSASTTELRPLFLTMRFVPKVTEFGLAKYLDQAAGHTRAGIPLGTPSYMAPEQARGEVDRIERPTDVYALGAILYECLTGRPPFKGATPTDTLIQVKYNDPVPPRQLQPKVPKDLETICLTCLQKDPRRRYATAAALAADLGCFQRGEPIIARPVGRLERMVKWVRRRPTVAALLAAVVLLFVTGLTVSTSFAVMLGQRNDELATARDKATELARENKAEANKAREAARQAEDRLHELKIIRAESLLRPLGINPNTAVNDHELEALSELAASTDVDVRKLFFEKALKTPSSVQQLAGRVQLAVHAAVGLDHATRRHLLTLVRRQFRDPRTTQDVRVVCVYLAVELHETDRAFLGDAAVTLLEAMARMQAPHADPHLLNFFVRVAERLDHEQKTVVTTHLVNHFDKVRDSDALEQLTQAAALLAGQLDADQAGPLARAVIRKLPDACLLGKAEARLSLVKLFQGLAPVLHPAQVLVCADEVLKHMDKADDPLLLAALTEILEETLERLAEPQAKARAGHVAPRLAKVIVARNDPLTCINLAPALAILAARLNHREATQLVDPAVQRVLTQLSEPQAPERLPDLCRALRMLLDSCGPQQAHAWAGEALKVISARRLNYPYSGRAYLTKAYAALVPSLKAEQLAATSMQLLRKLKATRSETAFVELQDFLQAGFSGLEVATKQRCAAAVSNELQARMGVAVANPEEFDQLTEAFARIAPELSPDDARTAAMQLAEFLNQVHHENSLLALSGAFQSLTGGLEPTQRQAFAGKARERIKGLMDRYSAANIPLSLAQSWTAVIALATRDEAPLAAAEVVDLLGRASNPQVVAELTRGLDPLSRKLERDQAAALAEKVFELVKGAKDPELLTCYAEALQVLWLNLDKKQAGVMAPVVVDQVLHALPALDRRPEDGRSFARLLLATLPLARQVALAKQQQLGAAAGSAALRLLDRGAAVELSQALAGALNELPIAPGQRLQLARKLAKHLCKAKPLEATELAGAFQAALPPLEDQQLLSLLRYPTCVGKSQVLVLRDFGRRWRQQFDSVWALVNWIGTHRRSLDVRVSVP